MVGAVKFPRQNFEKLLMRSSEILRPRMMERNRQVVRVTGSLDTEPSLGPDAWQRHRDCDPAPNRVAARDVVSRTTEIVNSADFSDRVQRTFKRRDTSPDVDEHVEACRWARGKAERIGEVQTSITRCTRP